jgi:excisionase family DNA binding protein
MTKLGINMNNYTVKEFANILKITPAAVHKMIKSGVIAAEKFATVWMIPRSELIKAQRRKGRGRPRKD